MFTGERKPEINYDFFPFILTFNFCTGKEEEGKNDVDYSDFIFAFKLLFALEGRRENEGQEDIEL